MKIKVLLLFFFIMLVCCQRSVGNIEGPLIGNAGTDWTKELSKEDIPIYTYKIIQVYPHDTQSFTEGLEFSQNVLYESSGLYRQSKLRKIDLNKGQLVQEYILPPQYFAEGITLLGNRLYQLTYESNVGFVYDKNTLQIKSTFHYPTQGWGLTNNGKELILSNGSASILFLDPNNFNIKRFIIVHHNDTIIAPINELEYINHKIYANIYGAEIIAIINPNDGRIEGWINLHGLYNVPQQYAWVEVLNGIAYDKNDDTLIVTGKFWPKLYKIKIIPKKK